MCRMQKKHEHTKAAKLSKHNYKAQLIVSRNATKDGSAATEACLHKVIIGKRIVQIQKQLF